MVQLPMRPPGNRLGESVIMKIADIRASVHEMAVPVPLLEKPSKRRFLFCTVETDDGRTGYAVSGGAHLAHAVPVALTHHFLPLLKGMDPRDTEAIHEAVWWTLNQRTLTGVVSTALSLVDIACWDLHGKAAGRTIAQLLGGCRDHAPCYITFGFPEYDTEQLAEAARMQVKAGFKRLKMVVAVHPGGWQEDVRRIRAVRDAVGDDVELMCDANYCWQPVEAKMFLRAVEACNLTWIEEPLYQNDARAMADLRRSTRTPIAAGQNEGHRWRLRELIERQAVDIIQPNVAYCGGFTEAQKVAHMAQAFNLPIANGGGWPRLNMHTMAGLMNGWRVEFHLDMTALEDRIWTDAPQPDGKDQVIRLNDAPGLGLTPDPDALKDSEITPSA
jgi:L-alanine-DL-glutamate epimerase-like enolase superfamily enzyme